MNKISYEERVKVYDDALKTFGIGSQLVVALEELSECQKEICKALRGECNTLHLAEEVADATIMLEQIRQIFKINPEVCKVMDEKVARLHQRVEDRWAAQNRGRDLLRKIFTGEEKTESGLLEED